jgi:hypothetical protein
MLLTLTCSSTIHTERIVAFSLQLWLLERATMLRYTQIIYFALLPSIQDSLCDDLVL